MGLFVSVHIVLRHKVYEKKTRLGWKDKIWTDEECFRDFLMFLEAPNTKLEISMICCVLEL